MTASTCSKPINTYMIRTHGRTYCPACGTAITPKTYTVRYGVMWCIRCDPRGLTDGDWLMTALRWCGLSHQWDTDHGVRMWQPPDPKDGIVSAYLLDRRHALRASSLRDAYYSRMIPSDA
ncbi:hypothetical protein ES708_11910 [subsurface metagenome]